jgi:hypothetical protein
MAQQSEIESGDRSGDNVFLCKERVSLERAYTKKLGGMFPLSNIIGTY